MTNDWRLLMSIFPLFAALAVSSRADELQPLIKVAPVAAAKPARVLKINPKLFTLPGFALLQDGSGPRCHAKACASKVVEKGEKESPRDRGDRERRERLSKGLAMTHSKPGLYMRTSVYDKDRQEIDCREFPIEECFNRDEQGRDALFVYDYIRSEKGGDIFWSAENVFGLRGASGKPWTASKPHQYRGTPGQGKIVWRYQGDEADQWKPPCALKRLNGWQEMMEDRVINGKKAASITASFLEHLAKAPTAPEEDE